MRTFLKELFCWKYVHIHKKSWKCLMRHKLETFLRKNFVQRLKGFFNKMWKRNTTFFEMYYVHIEIHVRKARASFMKTADSIDLFWILLLLQKKLIPIFPFCKKWYFTLFNVRPYWNIWIINVKKGAANRFLYRFLALWSVFYLHICNFFFVQLFASPKSISNINLYPLIFFFSEGILQSRFIDWWIRLKSPFTFSDSASLVSFQTVPQSDIYKC